MATTYTHLLARAVVRPLVGTGVTPNHLTTLRLIIGMAACAGVALGTAEGRLYGGGLWLVSAFLDRADGELARIGDMTSEAGRRYDCLSDALINSLVFLAAGVGARGGFLGPWSIPVGVIAGGAMMACWMVGEAYQTLEGSGAKAYEGRWGFDVDDGLYLVAPLIWLNLMGFLVAAAAPVTASMAVLIVVRLNRLKRTRGLR